MGNGFKSMRFYDREDESVSTLNKEKDSEVRFVTTAIRNGDVRSVRVANSRGHDSTVTIRHAVLGGAKVIENNELDEEYAAPH